MNQLLSLLVCALVLAGAGPDRVKMIDGKVREGRVVQESRDAIVLRENKTDKTIPRGEIAELSTLERSLAAITAQTIPTGDAKALAALAEECKKAGLEDEAHLMWLRALLADPSHAGAIEALEAKALKDDVLLPWNKERRKLSELREPQAKWRDAYELQTTHFVVKTDLPLPRALEIGLNLERFHKTFYELLGWPLELYVLDPRELPEVRVYATADSLPSPPVAGERVWFGVAENCLHVAADKPVYLPAVVAELSRQMLYSSLRRSAGPTAQVPSWVSIGISQYFSSTVPPEPESPWPGAEKPIRPLFEQAAKTDFTFERLLRAVPNDFTDGPQAADMAACAYTLMHFFVYGRNGALRTGFGHYVTEGAKGKLSMSALTGAVEMKPDEIDKAWREHVQANAR